MLNDFIMFNLYFKELQVEVENAEKRCQIALKRLLSTRHDMDVLVSWKLNTSLM